MTNFEQFWIDLSNPTVSLEFAALLGCVVLAWFCTRWWSRGADQNSILFGRRVVDGLLFPLLALALVFFFKTHWIKTHHAPLMTLVVPILASVVMVRLIARVLGVVFPRSPSVRGLGKGLSWLVWVIAALWISGFGEAFLIDLDDIQITIGKSHFTLLHAAQALLASTVALVLTLWLSAALEQKLLVRTIQDLSMRKVATNALRALLLTVGALLVLSLLGVDLTALSVLGGAVGVGLGFGLQKLAANYISGFVILLERSIRIGDYIRVENIEGRITDIKTRYTLIQAINGSEAIIPNETMMTQSVENLSLQSTNYLTHCIFTVRQDSPVALVLTTLVQAARSVPEVLTSPEPSALLLEVTPLGLRFQLNFWIADASQGQGLTRSKINVAVLEAFQHQGIELASVTQDLRLAAYR